MNQKLKTSRSQFDWEHETHSWGAVTRATHNIQSGLTVCFNVFLNGEDNSLIYKGTFYFGKASVEKGTMSLRMNVTPDLLEPGSHSIITTNYTNAINDPVAIAARLMLALKMEGDHFFLDNDL